MCSKSSRRCKGYSRSTCPKTSCTWLCICIQRRNRRSRKKHGTKKWSASQALNIQEMISSRSSRQEIQERFRKFVKMTNGKITQTAALAAIRRVIDEDATIPITAGGSLPSCMQRMWTTDKRGGSSCRIRIFLHGI